MGDSEKASRSRRTEDDCLSAELNNEFSEACQQSQNPVRIQITYHDNMDDGAVYKICVSLSELVPIPQNQLGRQPKGLYSILGMGPAGPSVPGFNSGFRVVK